jgi:hypothetical protein
LRSSVAELRIEAVAQSVAKHVEGEDQQHDGEAWREHEMGRDLDEFVPCAEHRSPFGRRRLHA